MDQSTTLPLNFKLKGDGLCSCFSVGMVTLAALHGMVSTLPAQHSCDHGAGQAGVVQGEMEEKH